MRRSEWLLTGYFLYTSILAVTLDLKPPIPMITLLVNAMVIGAYAFLVWADGFRSKLLLGVIRDWFPLQLSLLAYRQMGWFAPATHDFALERSWVQLDRWLLREAGLKNAVEMLGPFLPSLLELSYSLVYVLAPFSMAMLYVYHARQRAETFLEVFLASVLVAYALFPFFPSEPPRTVFPGQDYPGYYTVFRQFNWWLLGGYGIHTSVFPSAHVSGAFSAAFGMRLALPEHPWVWRLLLAMAMSIATATVYGRYHYAVDAIAGFFIAAAVFVFAALGAGARR